MIFSENRERCVFVNMVLWISYALGEPIGEPVVQHGPFVLTSEEELMKTFDDYRKGQNGFERAPGWKSKQGTEALKARER